MVERVILHAAMSNASLIRNKNSYICIYIQFFISNSKYNHTIGRVVVGLSLPEPTHLKHCQYQPPLPYKYRQVVRALKTRLQVAKNPFLHYPSFRLPVPPLITPLYFDSLH